MTFVGGLGGFPPHSRDDIHPGEDAPREVAPARWCGRAVVVCLSVCLLRIELVRDGLTDRNKTFGGDIWHCQERISLKPARPVDIWGVRRLKKWF